MKKKTTPNAKQYGPKKPGSYSVTGKVILVRMVIVISATIMGFAVIVQAYE